jgi:16S rRNA U1498 N3-methylase RsmE
VARSSTTLDSARAAQLGRISAALRNQQEVTPEQRRARTRVAREARDAKRLDRARARAAELGFDALTPAELERLQSALEAERVARMQLASSDAARRRRVTVPA